MIKWSKFCNALFVPFLNHILLLKLTHSENFLLFPFLFLFPLLFLLPISLGIGNSVFLYFWHCFCFQILQKVLKKLYIYVNLTSFFLFIICQTKTFNNFRFLFNAFHGLFIFSFRIFILN